MTPETITLVRQSWSKVAAIAPQAAALFYQNLFAADPRLRSLFKGDMERQGRLLTHMVGLAVDALDDLGTLVPVLQDLARRHVGYGVQSADYQTVGAALLETLDQGLGNDFTPPVRAAWASTYALVADVMFTAGAAS